MQRIGRLSEFRDGIVTKTTLGGEDIVVARDGSIISAFAAKCPHAGAPLEEGAIYNHRLICPWHKATFCLRDGAVVEPPALDRLTRYPVQIEGDDVFADPRPIDAEPEVGQIDGRVTLILGSGAAGTAAAVALREAGYRGRVTIIGDEALEPYDRTVLSKFVLCDMPPADVPRLRPEHYWASQRIDRLEATITRLDAVARKVHLADGTLLDYDAAVLATGATANAPNIPGVTLSGVHSLRSRQDAAFIVAAAKPSARVVIIGGSFIGLEAASALRERGLRVTVVAPEEIPFERQFGPEIGRMFRDLHEANGVVFQLRSKVARFGGRDHVDSVFMEGGQELPADLVVLGVGVSPATNFVDGVRKSEDGGVVVDNTLHAANGLYVAGDSASFPFGADHTRIEHWRVAQQQGRLAAANIAGRHEHYDAVPFFWTYHFGKNFEYIGHARDWDRVHIHGALKDHKFVALQIKGEDVVGVVACQREQTTAVLVERMRQPLKVSEACRLLRE
jgi:apoptosis-inducing factor 3